MPKPENIRRIVTGPKSENRSIRKSRSIGDSCPGRGAAFFMPLRRAGTVPGTGVRDGPGSAAHRSAKCYAALRPGHKSLMTLEKKIFAFLIPVPESGLIIAPVLSDKGAF